MSASVTAGTEPVLEISNLYAGYARRSILKDLSLTLERGEFTGLIGANGAGKTTLLRYILEEARSGQPAPIAAALDYERQLDREEIALEPIVAEVRDTLELADNRIGWITAIERDLVVDADPDQLLRVLLNLARNAVQALETKAPNDPARDQVRITGRREGAVVVIEVSDTGPGFPAKAKAHLFEPFQSSARSGGTGLGLVIAGELVRAHGGEIALVEGTIGATFRFTIPDRAVDLESRRPARARA